MIKTKYKSRYNLDHRYGVMPEILFKPIRIDEPVKEGKYGMRLSTNVHIPPAKPLPKFILNTNAPPIPKKSIKNNYISNIDKPYKKGSLDNLPEEGKRVIDHTQPMDILYLGKADQLLLDTKKQGFETAGSTQKWTGGKKGLVADDAPAFDFNRVQTPAFDNEAKKEFRKEASFAIAEQQVDDKINHKSAAPCARRAWRARASPT